MSESRERLSSRLGFILLSAGCAIGCGNVWKFPWMTGQNGGGIFVLFYLLFLLILGLPVMTMEFSIGRAAQASPIAMYQKLERPKQKWHIHGAFAFFGNVALMAMYTAVTGWMFYYFFLFVTGKTENLIATAENNPFANMIQEPGTNVLFTAIAIGIGFFILCFNLQGGLERFTKIMMVLLLILMIALAVNSCLLPNADVGLKFYLLPDFGKITPRAIVSAMNQAFFTLSLGIGSMAIFGSYIGKERSLMGESVNVILLDTFVAVMAGLIIFPACASNNLDVGAGPQLLFNTMATVFCQMPGGRIWGALFFLFMSFAALSTLLAVCENIVACVREKTGWSRPLACLICATVIFLLSLTTALGYSVLADFHPFGNPDLAWLDFWDFIVSNNLLPLGSVVFALFCCNRYGWGWDNFKREANAGKGLQVRDWMKFDFQWVIPIVTVFVWIIGLLDYFGVDLIKMIFG